MLKIKNKSIAIIGTSPIMILLYFKLQSTNTIDVYEHSSIGGAWKINKAKENSYTPHNNIIVALNKKEEKYIKSINKQLKNFRCKVINTKTKFELNTNYKPENTYVHDLANLFKLFKKECLSLKKSKVKGIKVIKKKILVNRKSYDYVFLPTCPDLDYVKIDNMRFKIKRKMSISHHLTIVLKKIKFNDISYTENFDNVFDRAYFRNKKDSIFFTGRVRRSFKKFSPSQLINYSEILTGVKHFINEIYLNKYNHSIIEQGCLKNMRLILKNSNLKIIETRQFVNSFIQLEKFF